MANLIDGRANKIMSTGNISEVVEAMKLKRFIKE